METETVEWMSEDWAGRVDYYCLSHENFACSCWYFAFHKFWNCAVYRNQDTAISVIQYMGSFIKQIREVQAEAAQKYLFQFNEFQSFYSEFGKIVEMFEQAKNKNSQKEWTIIYEKLSDLQNEIKQSEQYATIWDFYFQQQIFSCWEEQSSKEEEIVNLSNELKIKTLENENLK